MTDGAENPRRFFMPSFQQKLESRIGLAGVLCFDFKSNFAGGGPAASDFLLCGQKKVTKEKPPRLAGPSGFPALLAKPGGSATRPRKRGLRQCSPTTPGFAALLGGSQGGVVASRQY